MLGFGQIVQSRSTLGFLTGIMGIKPHTIKSCGEELTDLKPGVWYMATTDRYFSSPLYAKAVF